MIIIKYIGVGLLIILLLMVLLFTYYYVDHLRRPQKQTSKRQGLPSRTDYLIIAKIPANKWTKHLFLRIGIDLVDEPYTYIYRALLINNDTYVYKLDDIWVEKESNQETEYSKFIGLAVDNYLLTRNTESTTLETETNTANTKNLESIEIKITNNNKETTVRKKRVKPRRKSVEPLKDKNTNPETPSKNSFLYGADDFGEMKKGVVLESNTFTYDKEDKGDGFEIQPAPKK